MPDNGPDIVLFDYWRSSASFRVRIALNLKGLAYRTVPTSLLDGAQKAPDYVARNPQGLVPMLSVDGVDLTQSFAIIDYLDHLAPEPRLIPTDPLKRAETLARAMVIVADIHPVNNLRILKYLKSEMGQEQAAIDDWYRHWIAEGFAALEQRAPDTGSFGGDAPDVTDICLVPQCYNASRFDLDITPYPKLARIDAELRTHPAFAAAAPDAVKPPE